MNAGMACPLLLHLVHVMKSRPPHKKAELLFAHGSNIFQHGNELTQGRRDHAAPLDAPRPLPRSLSAQRVDAPPPREQLHTALLCSLPEAILLEEDQKVSEREDNSHGCQHCLRSAQLPTRFFEPPRPQVPLDPFTVSLPLLALPEVSTLLRLRSSLVPPPFPSLPSIIPSLIPLGSILLPLSSSRVNPS